MISEESRQSFKKELLLFFSFQNSLKNTPIDMNVEYVLFVVLLNIKSSNNGLGVNHLYLYLQVVPLQLLGRFYWGSRKMNQRKN